MTDNQTIGLLSSFSSKETGYLLPGCISQKRETLEVVFAAPEKEQMPAIVSSSAARSA